MSKRSANKIKVLPLEPDYDESKVSTIKHSRKVTNEDGSQEYTEMEVPRLDDDATAMQIVDFLTEFREARAQMRWTNGPKLFEKFRGQLRGNHKETFRTAAANNAPTETVASFALTVAEFTRNVLRGYKYDDQMDYLRDLKKPPSLDPSQFLLKLTALNRKACQLGDAPNGATGLTEREFKRAFFNGMLSSWQTNFINAGFVLEDTDTSDIMRYMMTQQAQDPFTKKSSEDNSSGGSSNDSGNRRGNNRSRRGNRGNRNNNSGRGGSNSNNNNRGNNQGRRWQDTDPCPVHDGHHEWGDCNSNAHNRQRRAARNNSGNNNNNNNRGGGHRYNTRSNNNNTNAGNNNNNGQNHHNQAADGSQNNGGNGNNNNNNNNGQRSNPNSGDNHYFEGNSTFEEFANGPESFFVAMEGDLEPEHYDAVPKVLQRATPTPVSLHEIPAPYCQPVEKKQTIASPGVSNQPNVEVIAYDEAAAEKASRMVPNTIATASQINGIKTKIILKSLLDHGGSHSMLNRRAIPPGTNVFNETSSKSFETTMGTFDSRKFIWMYKIRFPEFSMTRYIEKEKMYIFDAPHVEYDAIWGRTLLNPAGIDVRSSMMCAEWCNDKIPFHDHGYFRHNASLRKVLSVPSVRTTRAENHMTATIPTDASVPTVAAAQTHLDEKQRDDLLEVLSPRTTLFTGKLGYYKRRKFKIELKDDAVPYHCKRPYPVPHTIYNTFKDEIYRQVDEGILEQCYETEWGHPIFATPKKDGAIRIVDDMQQLNRQMKRKVYPLPKIQDIFHRRRGYKYFTKIDLTLMYYSFVLEEESTWYCILVTPFGKFRRKRLPMGLTQSPDWAQAAVEECLQSLLHDHVEVYIDDVGVFSNSWDEHVKAIASTLRLLEDDGFTVNPAKCEWAVAETDWLGHWLTPVGLKPWKKKVQGILQVAIPQTLKQLRGFIGMVNYYRDFWKRRAHVMAPLTNLIKVGPKRFRRLWSTDCTAAFNKVKALLAEDVLLRFPDPNKKYIIETDASDYQLGAVIWQDNCPVAFFSRKLTDAQRRYPTMDKEALCITEVLEEFRPILYGTDLEIHTDHMNLTARDMRSQRLLNWRLLIEEFAPIFVYKPGAENVVADGLSRLPLEPGEKYDDDTHMMSALNECLLYYPEDIDAFPLQFPAIATAQQADADIQALLNRDDHELQDYHGTQLVCQQRNNTWRIVLPEALVDDTIAWYHFVLGHGGMTRVIATLSSFLYIKNLRQRVEDYISTYDSCQRNKFPGPQYGELPAREDTSSPFSEVAADLIGPWSIEIPGFGTIEFQALTMINVATTVCELRRVENKTSEHVSMLFENEWLSRYPKPLRVIHDQGGEFAGNAFQSTLAVEGIEAAPTTSKNPQSNAIVERLHKTIGDQIRTLVREDPPANIESATELVDTVLAAAQRAMRTATHRTLGVSPGAMVFGRDMLLDIPILTDFNVIRQRRQAVIDDNARRANLRRRFKDYEVGDEVMILIKDPATLRDRTEGPYGITQIHVNGTVTLQRRQGVFERINIRRLRPYNRRA